MVHSYEPSGTLRLSNLTNAELLFKVAQRGSASSMGWDALLYETTTIAISLLLWFILSHVGKRVVKA